MSTAEKMPIYDDRVNEIIRSLKDGITREELAVKYKHRDYRSLDMYMRRRNFTWDSEEQNYKPVANRLNKDKMNEENIHTGKVSRIIEYFKEGHDPKTVATEFGFKNYKELATYMTQKGYEWDQETENYVRKSGIVSNEHIETESNIEETPQNESVKSKVKDTKEIIYLIKSLYEKLNIEINDPIVDRVPRYLVTGITKTKSVQMSHLLQQLIEDFSYEHNITQRQIMETAIIDFFRKYGYKNEMDALLQQ